jgi:hypothetical protein
MSAPSQPQKVVEHAAAGRDGTPTAPPRTEMSAPSRAEERP